MKESALQVSLVTVKNLTKLAGCRPVGAT